MSKKLGDNYLTEEIKKYHSADVERNHVTLEGGVKIALPRYYRDRIYDDDQKQQQRDAIEERNKKEESKQYDEFIQKYGNRKEYSFNYWKDTKKHARYKKFKSFTNRSKRDKI